MNQPSPVFIVKSFSEFNCGFRNDFDFFVFRGIMRALLISTQQNTYGRVGWWIGRGIP